ncbi:MAG: hypothetical protein ACLTTZ_02035 [Lachnospiraceae bacterium]
MDFLPGLFYNAGAVLLYVLEDVGQEEMLGRIEQAVSPVVEERYSL